MIEDDWDFYPCWVDDASASICLNLALAKAAPIEGEDTLYAAQISMRDADQHGMGSSEEAETLWPIEDQIIESVSPLGCRFVGRLRNNGVWQLTFMGPAGAEPDLAREIRGTLAPSGHAFELFSKPDHAWSYYLEFLHPNHERMQWIMNRRVVDSLAKHGDPLTEARRIDHWIYFADSPKRDAFAGAATARGFSSSELEPTDGQRPLGLQIWRTDHVELEKIHALTMELERLAQQHEGEYDGWESLALKEQ